MRIKETMTILALTSLALACAESKTEADPYAYCKTNRATYAEVDENAPSRPGIIVRGGDYQTSTISLIDPMTGTLESENILHSGSVSPELSTALSGDLQLAQAPSLAHHAVVIDRSSSIVTLVDRVTNEPVAQLTVGASDYGVNPSDYLQIDASKAYVARFGVDLADDGRLKEGDDILVVTCQEDKPVFNRIELNDLKISPSENTSATPYARPAQLQPLDGGYVLVLLQNLTLDFYGGEANFAVIDSKNDVVAATLSVPGIKNCQSLVYSSAVSEVYVSCGGSFKDLDQRAGAALLVLDVADPTAPRVKAKSPVTDLLGSGETLWSSIGLVDDQTVVVTAADVAAYSRDVLYLVDLSAPTAVTVEVAAYGNFSSRVFADTTNKRVYLADYTYGAEKVDVYKYDADAAMALTLERSITFTEALPALTIAGY